MYYKPHILQKRLSPQRQNDEYGRPIVVGRSIEWVDVCKCRCDHNEDKEVKTDDGKVITPNYHIVLEGNIPDLKVGDYIRCLREDGSVRGEGAVIRLKTLNRLPYAEIYV